MNPTVMHGLAIGLLVSFGIVIGIAIVFATLYRRCLWKNGSLVEIQQGGLNLGLNDRPDTLFTV